MPQTGVTGSGVDAQVRLQLALDAAAMGLWDWDLLSGALVWDERSAHMYGTTVAKSTGSIEDVESRLHPDDLERVRAVLAEAIAQVGTVDVEFRVRWPDGTVRWLYGRGQALAGADGSAIRMIGTNVDVTELREEALERAADSVRMAGLVSVAQALGEAQSEEDVLGIVTGKGAGLLGAQGAVLCLLGPAGASVRALTTEFFQADVRAAVAVLPPDFPLPMIRAATTGESFFLADQGAVATAFPGGLPLYQQARTQGSAAVPLRAQGRVLGSLSVAFDTPFAWRQADRELLKAFAVLTSQAVDRIQARQAELESSQEVRRLSETLQASLLTEPPVVPGARIAVRYVPAAQQAQIGGDWHDSFLNPRGALTLVIGDVAGHDQDAAAAMAQVRNILRGVAQSDSGSPAAVLTALDRALHTLRLTTLASAVLCELHVRCAEDSDGEWLLRWSNAGHLPPLLIGPEGTVELLTTTPELLLGLEPDGPRIDHERALRPGSTLVLVTDGLIERRTSSIDDDLMRLRQAAAGLHQLTPEALCDALLARFGQDADDDVALLVLQLDPPLDGPRLAAS